MIVVLLQEMMTDVAVTVEEGTANEEEVEEIGGVTDVENMTVIVPVIAIVVVAAAIGVILVHLVGRETADTLVEVETGDKTIGDTTEDKIRQICEFSRNSEHKRFCYYTICTFSRFADKSKALLEGRYLDTNGSTLFGIVNNLQHFSIYLYHCESVTH
mmetsp:Transcript_5373/g.6536  ORF Transcript_5373/g.6536 Transcript_5373/m.6536 type:complete len:158 (+) Transcript_5373:27-500(+)